jgi:hypothetical protein
VHVEALEHLFFDVFDVGELAPTSDIAVFTGALNLHNESPTPACPVFFPFPGFPSVFLGSSDSAPGRPGLFARFTRSGDGLGAMWGKEMAVQYLQEAGFHSVEVHELAHDFQNYYSTSAGLEGRRFSSRLRPQRTRAGNRR